jgi:hypothetical protein
VAAVKLAAYLPSRFQRLLMKDRERRTKTALMRDVLKVLEGTGHESAAKVLRGVFGEYQ